MDYLQVDQNKIICHMSRNCGSNRHDPAFEAAIYILASLKNPSLIEKVSEQTIDFNSIFNTYADHSASEQALVKLAASLHDPEQYQVTVADIFAGLNPQQRKTAIWGILVRYPAIEGI